jgi:hypothetical protein
MRVDNKIIDHDEGRQPDHDKLYTPVHKSISGNERFNESGNNEKGNKSDHDFQSFHGADLK